MSYYPCGRGVSGVYAILIDDVVRYVGSSRRCICNRVSHHIAKLKSGEHLCLQHLWDTHSFKFTVLEECDPIIVREREVYYTNQHLATLLSERPEGRRWEHRSDTIKKMSEAARRVGRDPEERTRRSIRAKQQHKDGRFAQPWATLYSGPPAPLEDRDVGDH